ncbi:12649_t:CDS:2, partial [Gigaspora margarita]
ITKGETIPNLEYAKQFNRWLQQAARNAMSSLKNAMSSDPKVQKYLQSLEIIDQIRRDNRGEKTNSLQELFIRIKEAKKIFEEAENNN